MCLKDDGNIPVVKFWIHQKLLNSQYSYCCYSAIWTIIQADDSCITDWLHSRMETDEMKTNREALEGFSVGFLLLSFNLIMKPVCHANMSLRVKQAIKSTPTNNIFSSIYKWFERSIQNFVNFWVTFSFYIIFSILSMHNEGF